MIPSRFVWGILPRLSLPLPGYVHLQPFVGQIQLARFSVAMQTRFQKRPFDDSLSTMSRHLHKQKMVWDYGWQTPSKKGEQKQQLWIYLDDCQPSEMPHTP